MNKDIQTIDLGLYLVKHKTLVIADSHIGYEEGLQKKGVLVPMLQFKDILQRLEKIFSSVDVEQIIFNGDIKHEFGTISRQEWRETFDLLDFLGKKAKIVLIKGNHDTILGPIAMRKNLEIKDYVIIGDFFVTHGHKIFEIPKEIKTIIIAHEHPAVTLKEGGRCEKYKCFLKGEYKGKHLIVIPSLLQVTQGTDVLKEELLSPYLKQNLKNFDVYISGDKIYSFGKLKNLK
jgi:putative SbcD/Mre11-related phosphoesterase